MYHRPSKRKAVIERIVVYSLICTVVALLVAIMVAIMIGYRLDDHWRLQQAGLVRFETKPGGATVEVDGRTLGLRTGTKTTVFPGAHEFVIWREGYETWRKTLTTHAGTLTALTYPRLIPKQRPVESVVRFDRLAQARFAPDGRWLATLVTTDRPDLALYDLQADEPRPTPLDNLPADLFSATDEAGLSHQYQIDHWSNNSRYFLIKHQYGDKTEWVVIDRDSPAKSVNVNRALNLEFDQPFLEGTTLYVRSGTDVRKLDVHAGTISRPLASQVEGYYYGVGAVVYWTQPAADGSRQIGLVRGDDKEPAVVTTVPSQRRTDPIRVLTAQYNGRDALVYAVGRDVTIRTGSFESLFDKDKDQAMKVLSQFQTGAVVDHLLSSPGGRFVTAQYDDKFVTYDLDMWVRSDEATLAGSGQARRLRWLDGYLVWSDRADGLTVREFDGANQHTTNPVASGFDAALGRGGTYLYSIGRQGDGNNGYQLQRVKLVL